MIDSRELFGLVGCPPESSDVVAALYSGVAADCIPPGPSDVEDPWIVFLLDLHMLRILHLE